MAGDAREERGGGMTTWQSHDAPRSIWRSRAPSTTARVPRRRRWRACGREEAHHREQRREEGAHDPR